jgi:hypothetical protein
MKKITSWVVFVLVISLIFLQGCAADKSLLKKDLTTLSPLKVVYHETPSIRRSALGGTMFTVATGGLGAVAIGDAVGESDEKEAQEKRYDFGYIVMKGFVERASKEISNWPLMNVIDKPVSDDYADQSPLLEFKVNRLMYGYRGASVASGFQSETVVIMKDSRSDILWQKSFKYSPDEFNRKRTLVELEADNYKLLKEEIEFAAENTVSEFIEYFKGREKP